MGRLKLNFLTVGLLLLRVYLRATDIVALFFDWKWARPAPPHAGRYTVASRFRCRSCERGYILQGLQNSSLPPRSAL